MILPVQGRDHVGAPEALVDYANSSDWILPPVDTYFGRACRFACARSGIEPKVQHLVTDTAVAIALAESGVGITLATPLMMTLRPTTAPSAAMPGESMRSIVAIVRSAALERDSVRA
ncbi:LysR substrate-binding domain-containing protein, partial [Escherichia coli]|uniref:LysR substrate-binding domain-containing protein n=1 Tax=Escherichia coli TaxID=562 RepID=UPI0032E46691